MTTKSITHLFFSFTKFPTISQDRRTLSPPVIVKLIVTNAETGEEISPTEVNSSLYILAAELRQSNEPTCDLRGVLVHQNTRPISHSRVQGDQISSCSTEGKQEMPSKSDISLATLIRRPGSTYGRQSIFGSRKVEEFPSKASITSQLMPVTTTSLPLLPSNKALHLHSKCIDFHAAAAAERIRGDSGHAHSINDISSRQRCHPISTTESVVRYARNLVGAVVTSAKILRDENDQLYIFFVLQDLSVRSEGSYQIRLLLTDLAQKDVDAVKSVSSALAETYTNTFIVYSHRDFPGMLETTSLVKKLNSQGAKIANREKNKKHHWK